MSEFPHLQLIPHIADIRDEVRMDAIMNMYKPNVIIHAAAYKHVPIMEYNFYESIRTNVKGTKILSSLAEKYSVEKFVMVSTDKAVNPTNIMGTTKRIAEMICQSSWYKFTNTKFVTVRFGNVLGSSGSVIPLFQKQIENGDSVTITHKDINRYFMSIPEASQLVLQAGAIGNGGEIFVLDMGEPVKILDLAKQMIKLAGLKLGEDIEIEFTGLRPGEKLYEELLMDDEKTLETIHPKVRVAKSRTDFSNFEENLSALLNLSPCESFPIFQEQLKTIVPEYITPEEHQALSHCETVTLQ